MRTVHDAKDITRLKQHTEDGHVLAIHTDADGLIGSATSYAVVYTAESDLKSELWLHGYCYRSIEAAWVKAIIADHDELASVGQIVPLDDFAQSVTQRNMTSMPAGYKTPLAINGWRRCWSNLDTAVYSRRYR